MLWSWNKATVIEHVIIQYSSPELLTINMQKFSMHHFFFFFFYSVQEHQCCNFGHRWSRARHHIDHHIAWHFLPVKYRSIVHTASPTQPEGPAADEQTATSAAAQDTGAAAVAAWRAPPGPAAAADWGSCWEGTAPHHPLAPAAWLWFEPADTMHNCWELFN